MITSKRHVLDRDLNAAKNILKEGLKIYRQELAITRVERKSDFGNKSTLYETRSHPIAFGVVGSSLLNEDAYLENNVNYQFITSEKYNVLLSNRIEKTLYFSDVMN